MKSEEKITIKQFKDKSSNYFVNNKHYHLDENNMVVFVCGGIENIKETEYLKAYIKRKKSVFIPREPSIFENEPKDYKEVITFGQHKGKTVQEMYETERKYLSWMMKNFKFSSAQENLKKEIIEILS